MQYSKDGIFLEQMMSSERQTENDVTNDDYEETLRYVLAIRIIVMSKNGQEILLDIERLCDFSFMWYTLLLFKNSFFIVI